MPINQLVNKKVVVFGSNCAIKNFANFLLKNDISVIFSDEKECNFDIEKKELVSFADRTNINWSEIDCLVVWQDDKSIVEMAKKNNCPVFSIVEFFEKYFSEYNYIGLIGETGSSIASDMLKYLFCKMKMNLDYDICKKESYFTLAKFGDTKSYILELDQEIFPLLQSPHFNNIILFDLNYNNNDIAKIKNMILNQTEDDFTILNIDNRDVKEFYNSVKDDSNYKTQLIPISINKIQKDGVSFVNNEIYTNVDDKNDEFITNEFKNLDGEQNKTNILAVSTLLLKLGYNIQEIIEDLYNFKTSDDVFELVLHKENFVFINDIKNKNKAQSLISFDNIYWILCIDEIDFEFSEFLKLVEYFDKVKYVFITGNYNEEILKIFRDNEINYFIMYDMNNIFRKIEELMENEKREEKITVLLSSINDIEDSSFYEECSEDFEKMVNEGE